jgi:hypothetical protein
VSLTSPIALRNCGSTESDEDLELIEDVRQIYSQIKTSGTLYESTSLLRKILKRLKDIVHSDAEGSGHSRRCGYARRGINHFRDLTHHSPFAAGRNARDLDLGGEFARLAPRLHSRPANQGSNIGRRKDM